MVVMKGVRLCLAECRHRIQKLSVGIGAELATMAATSVATFRNKMGSVWAKCQLMNLTYAFCISIRPFCILFVQDKPAYEA